MICHATCATHVSHTNMGYHTHLHTQFNDMAINLHRHRRLGFTLFGLVSHQSRMSPESNLVCPSPPGYSSGLNKSLYKGPCG